MKEWNIPGGFLQYTETPNEVTIVGSSALLVFVEIPERIEGKPVTGIDKKAFLSKKYLKRVTVPDTVDTIGDWAFGYCDRLEEVIVPCRAIRFGKNVFLDDHSLKSITIMDKPESIGRLLAAAIGLLRAEYLLQVDEAGEPEWLAKWDAKMLSVLEEEDAEGYSGQVLCGEEDYGSTNFGAYINKRRRRKVSILYNRLLCREGLSEATRQKLVAYLLAHTKGCESEESWEVVLGNHSMDRPVYTMFVELGLLTRENRSAVIADIGEDAPEMKAYFLAQFEEEKKADAFFDGLDF